MTTESAHEEDVAIFNAQSPNIKTICEGKADETKGEETNPEIWLETSTLLSHQLVEELDGKSQGSRPHQHD